jgi:hypothetical protein
MSCAKYLKQASVLPADIIFLIAAISAGNTGILQFVGKHDGVQMHNFLSVSDIRVCCKYASTLYHCY